MDLLPGPLDASFQLSAWHFLHPEMGSEIRSFCHDWGCKFPKRMEKDKELAELIEETKNELIEETKNELVI